jgi:hypothetical protein
MIVRSLIIIITFTFLSRSAVGQQAYWQQDLQYTIDVTLDDKHHTLKGFLNLNYTNNSPDKLDYIYFHLWTNGYKNENTAYAKQVFRDKEGKKTWKLLKDNGYIDSLRFSVEGISAAIEADPLNIDVIKVLLPQPLEAGKTINIQTPFFVKLPTYVSRMGHLGQSYMVCQWYPKPAVYDRKGWHAFPYLEQGEFYADYGSFKVNITLPSEYVVGASGKMENLEEFNLYKDLGTKNLKTAKGNQKFALSKKGTSKTLTYRSDSIHDFAWFADKNFIIEYDTLKMNSGKIIDVFGYHQENGVKYWENSTEYIKDAIRKYSSWIGDYPYSIVQAVEGPENASSGGMEYPMITLITNPKADEEKLDAIITHEVGHNWFYGILGSNEREYAWMDEGINTYYQFRYEAEKYKGNSIFGQSIPEELKTKSVEEFQNAIYNALNRIPMDKAIETHSAAFSSKEEYGMVVYFKSAIWLYIMQLTYNRESFDKAMQNYFNKWKFRHPYPEDFKAALEESLKTNIDPVFEIRNKTGTLE